LIPEHVGLKPRNVSGQFPDGSPPHSAAHNKQPRKEDTSEAFVYHVKNGRDVRVRLFKLVLAFALLAIVLFGAEPDPFIGKWKLNWAKSHSSQPRPKSVVRSYQRSGKGVRVQETWVYGDGKQEKVDYTANYDGHDYPVGAAKGKTVAFTRLDLYSVEGVSKSDGKTEYTFKRSVSKDGNTLTVEMTKADSAGKMSTEVLVYDKME
jgi:hypothetical protein